MPIAPPKPAPAKDRLALARARIADPTLARKRYRLLVVPSRGAGGEPVPAPFVSCTINGQCFAETTSVRTEDPRRPGRGILKEQAGAIARLTDGEVEALRARIGDYVVRWQNRAAGIAIVIDAAIPTVHLDPTSDEPIEPWLRIEELDA